MAEPTRQQVGEGSDNYGQAARQMAKAAKTAGKTAKTAAQKGIEATANAAASTVRAGVEMGKAVAEVAAGTASGGPWGSIISAAWAMRHTLFKILVCICMFVLILIIVIVSLPSIVFENLLGKDNDDYGEGMNAFYASYDDLSLTVNDTINGAYQLTRSRVIDAITGSVFDVALSMKHLVDNAESQKKYDVCYILAAYSVSMGQMGTSKDNLMQKMQSVADKMFPVTYEEKTETRTIFDGANTLIETVPYIVCTISPFDDSVLLDAFGLELDKPYGKYGMTNGEYVEYTANALKKTLGDKIT